MPKRGLLSVSAEPGIAITVRDADFEPVAEGLESLRVELPLGLYDVLFVAGHGFDSQVVRVPAEGAQVTAPRVDFPTPAPLNFTDGDNAIRAVIDQVNRKPTKLGQGSELLVLVWDPSPAARSNAAAGISLRALAGTEVADIEALSKRSAPGTRPVWAAACLELPPGPYLLQVANGRTVLAQTVMLTEGWQTQVFLDRKPGGPLGPQRRASLPDAAVLMSRRGAGFNPHDTDIRLTELARIALLDQRRILSKNDIRALLAGKWDNPMLGLYGANVLLATEPQSTKALSIVRRNLHRLLGDDHPDVAALDARAGELTQPLAAPPMLRSSWNALVAASAKNPSIFRAGTLAASVANHLFGAGVWLTWDARKEQKRDQAAELQQTIISLSSGLEQLIATIVDQASELPTQTTYAPAGVSSPVTESVVAIASELARQQTAGLLQSTLSERDVVELIGAPSTIVATALDEAIKAFS